MDTTDVPPRLRSAQPIAYLLEPGCPSVVCAGVVVCVVNERYAVARVSRRDPPPLQRADHDVLVHRAGVGWVRLARFTDARGGWVAAVAHALANHEPDVALPFSMSGLLDELGATERRLGHLNEVAVVVNKACELPRPPPAGSGPDAVTVALGAVELEAMRAHACIQQERQILRDGLERLEGAVVDREALLTDLGHVLFELRCLGAARHDAERAFVAAYRACEVADEVDILEDGGAFSTAVSRFLRSVVAWWHVRPLIARRFAAAPAQRAA